VATVRSTSVWEDERVSEHSETVAEDGDDAASTGDPVAELVAHAREACADHPDLLELVGRIDRLDEVELSRRPEVLDAAHRTLREVLTGAGRPGPRP
jgi:hypothetical protein